MVRLVFRWLLVLSLAIWCGGSQVLAQAPIPAPDASAGDSRKPPVETADSWNFDDDQEAEPTLREILAPQLADLVAFPLFVALALVGFFKKSGPLKTATFVASILYLGVARSQLYSVVNIFGLLSWNLPIFSHNVFWYLFAGFTLVSTVLWGRLYCGRVCAFGALTQLMDRVVPAAWRYDVPLKTETRLAAIKYVLLGGVIVYYLATRDITIYRYVEPFWMFSGHGSAVMWLMLAALLAATVFVRNLYCRFLCPVGGSFRRHRPSFRSSDGRSAERARSARRRASGARYRARGS
jgi:hypothetical protein